MIFDASAIYVLVKTKRFDLLQDGTTLNLAHYELGNAVWNQVQMLKEITPQEGIEVLKFIIKTISLLRIVGISSEQTGILELAYDKGITFYDAAYVYIAQKHDEPLVTEDEKLRHTASSLVETFGIADLPE